MEQWCGLRQRTAILAVAMLALMGCKKRYYYRVNLEETGHTYLQSATLHGRSPENDENRIYGVQFARGEVGPSEELTLTYQTPCGTWTTKAPLDQYKVSEGTGLNQAQVEVYAPKLPNVVEVYFDPEWKGHTLDHSHDKIEEHVKVFLADCRTLKIDGKPIALPQDLGNDGYVLVGRKGGCYRAGVETYGSCPANENDKTERYEGAAAYVIKKRAPEYFFKPVDSSVLAHVGTSCIQQGFVQRCDSE